MTVRPFTKLPVELPGGASTSSEQTPDSRAAGSVYHEDSKPSGLPRNMSQNFNTGPVCYCSADTPRSFVAALF